MQQSTVNKSYQCSKCGFVFEKRDFLKNHASTCGLGRPYVCVVCFVGFKTEEEVVQHITTEHKTECEEMKAKSMRNEDVKSHRCETCEKIFPTKYHLQIHQLDHQDQEDILELCCCDCGVSFENKTALDKHHSEMKAKFSPRNSPNVAFTKCVDAEKRKPWLRNTVLVEPEENEDLLSIADPIYSEKSSISATPILAKKLEDHDCGDCGKRFGRKSSLKRHVRFHKTKDIKLRPHACEICRQEFTKRGLIVHQNMGCQKLKASSTMDENNVGKAIDSKKEKTKTLKQKQSNKRKSIPKLVKQENYSGNEFASKDKNKADITKTLKQKQSRKIKWVPKAKKPSNQCEICKGRFASKSHLVRHIRCVHELVRNEKCGVCGITFNRRFNLKRHTKTHKGKFSGVLETHRKVSNDKFVKRNRGGEVKTKADASRQSRSQMGDTKIISGKENLDENVRRNESVKKHRFKKQVDGHRIIKPYKCGICDAGFVVSVELVEHVEKNHQDVLLK